MSSIVAEFNPGTSNTAQFTAPQSSANGALVFFNESPNSLTLTFADGSNMYLPAWYHRHKCGASGSVNIDWVVHTVLSSGSPPMSLLIVEAFAQGEHYPADGPLVRQANGNVNTQVSGTSAIVNTGNAPGTSIITATPNDAGSATWSADNSGNLTIKGDNAGTLTTLLQLIAGASPAVKLAAAGIIAEALGGLKVDQTFESVGAATLDSTLSVTGNTTLTGTLAVKGTSSLDNGNITTDGFGDILLANNSALQVKDTGGTARSIVYLDASNLTVLRAGALVGDILIEDQDRTVIAGFTNQISSAVTVGGSGGLTVSKVFFNIGAIKDLNKGSFSASGTYNHGLSGTPTIVLLCPSLSGSTWTFSAYTFTTTQFSATINTAANTNWYAYR